MTVNKSNTSTPVKPWVIYTRVSTEEQAATGHSLAAQEAACRNMCMSRGLPIAQVFSDPGESAKNLERPQVQKLMALVHEQKIGGIAVWRLDRLTRNLRDLLDLVDLFEKTGTAFASVCENIATDTPAGRMMLSILGSVAQWERETIAERIRLGVRQRIQEGGWIGGPVPAGCKVIASDGKKKRLIVDPEVGPLVTPIWSMIAKGAVINDVAIYLTEKGIVAPRNMGWRPATVHSLLSQERLVGLLVDRATFDACHEALEARSCPSRPVGGVRLACQGRSERVWPLANLARCAYCGSTLFGYSSKGRRGGVHPYLRCTKKTKKLCTAPDLPAKAWEQAVCTALEMVLVDDGPYARRLNEITVELERRAGNQHEEMAALAKERDAMQGRIQRLIDLAEAGDAPVRGIADRLKALEQAAAKLDVKMAEIEGLNSASRIDAGTVETLLQQLQAGAIGLKDRPVEDQKTVLQGLLSGVIIGHHKPITLNLWMPDLVVLAGSKETLEANAPTPTAGVSCGGRGFVWSSRMVEVRETDPRTLRLSH
jgi:site-specific DNA recombinase